MISDSRPYICDVYNDWVCLPELMYTRWQADTAESTRLLAHR